MDCDWAILCQCLLDSCLIANLINLQHLCSHFRSGHSGCKDLEASRAMMKTKMPSEEKPYLEHYAILIRPKTQTANDTELEMIGDVCIPRISDDGLASEIGYGIIPEYWGKGYAPEAVKMLVKYFFDGNSKFTATCREIAR